VLEIVLFPADGMAMPCKRKSSSLSHKTELALRLLALPAAKTRSFITPFYSPMDKRKPTLFPRWSLVSEAVQDSSLLQRPKRTVQNVPSSLAIFFTVHIPFAF